MKRVTATNRINIRGTMGHSLLNNRTAKNSVICEKRAFLLSLPNGGCQKPHTTRLHSQQFYKAHNTLSPLSSQNYTSAINHTHTVSLPNYAQ